MEINEEKIVNIEDFFTLSQEEEGIYEIYTPQGWVEVGDIVKKTNKKCFTIRTKNGKFLSGSNDHYVETTNGWEKLEDINVQNCFVNTEDGREEIVSLEDIGIHDTFDLEVLNDDHKYYSNGFVSHNTGKSTIGHIVCNNIPDHTVMWITPEILAQGRTFDSIKSLYKLADFVSPSIILLEDLDLFSVDRSSGGSLLGLGSLMNILDGINAVKNAITIGTTNRLDVIEKALTNRPGRFDRIMEIGSLNKVLREKMLKNRLFQWTYGNDAIENIVDKTENWTGAEMQEFVNTLNLEFIRSNASKKILTVEMSDKIIEIMNQFGIGIYNDGKFGFSREKD